MALDEPLPDYSSLPQLPGGGRSGWGLFGTDDNVGMFNLQTPERVAAAARLVRKGAVFSMNAPMDVISPPMFDRKSLRRTPIVPAHERSMDDIFDEFSPQSSSQWDALSHAAYEPGSFYNGVSTSEILAEGRNAIHHVAERGIAGRAVIVDLESVLRAGDADYDPTVPCAVTKEDLSACIAAQDVQVETGDVLIIHTGFLEWYRRHDDPATRDRLAARETLQTVGLERSEAMAEFIWNLHVSAVATDLPALEQWPPQFDYDRNPFGFLHRFIIGQFGISIGEFWDTAALAQDCRDDGRYEAFLVSAPLHVRGAAGSPANAIAIK